MPRCVSSMTFPATNFVAGSSSALRCNAQQAAAKAADLSSMVSAQMWPISQILIGYYSLVRAGDGHLRSSRK
jgi:hypothetical protein